MGFTNPPISWRELERQLSGRPAPLPAPRSITRPPSDDGRRGRLPGLVAQARCLRPPGGAPIAAPRNPTPYAELHAHSSFSFLDGASSPEELAEEAVRLGLQSLALTDHDGMYGVVRFAEAAAELGVATMFGAELGLDIEIPRTRSEQLISARSGTPDPDGRHLLVLARDPVGYASLCRAISAAAAPRRQQGPAGLRPG